MKKFLIITVSFIFLFFVASTTQSCSKKTGCPMNDDVHVKTKKNGMPKRKAKSKLFPKGMH